MRYFVWAQNCGGLALDIEANSAIEAAAKAADEHEWLRKEVICTRSGEEGSRIERWECDPDFDILPVR